MKTLQELMHAHPGTDRHYLPPAASAAQALAECAAACAVCADACLAEEKSGKMKRCIRANLDCGDLCAVASRLVLRQTTTMAALVHQVLHACVTACQVCADECAPFAQQHCRNCAEACHSAQAACNVLLGAVSSAGVVSTEA